MSASPTPLSSPKLICNKFVDKSKLASAVMETVLTVEFNSCPVRSCWIPSATLTLSMFVSKPVICPQALLPQES